MLNARFESSIHLGLLSQSGLPLSFAHIRQAMGCLLPLRWFANQLNERSPRCKRVKQPVDGIESSVPYQQPLPATKNGHDTESYHNRVAGYQLESMESRYGPNEMKIWQRKVENPVEQRSHSSTIGLKGYTF